VDENVVTLVGDDNVPEASEKSRSEPDELCELVTTNAVEELDDKSVAIPFGLYVLLVYVASSVKYGAEPPVNSTTKILCSEGSVTYAKLPDEANDAFLRALEVDVRLISPASVLLRRFTIEIFPDSVSTTTA
jgi:hypothetical protein